MTAFTPGIELSGAFYRDAVRPLLGGRSHAAALLGWGSELLGLDTPRSTDHGWGPRLLVLVDAADVGAVRAAVAGGLPDTFGGRPVRYGWDDVAVDHHVTVATLPEWLVEQLGVDATRGMTVADWLAVRAFHDRPAQVLMADRFADACRATVTDPVLRELPLIGGVDQFADSTDVLSDPAVYRRLVPALFSPSAGPAA